MLDVSDMELVQNYSRLDSEEAFAELVRRHINLVFSVALRHVGIPAHAEEITQAVFIILARKAASLRPDTVLEGWLYETTRLTSSSFLRGERRRQYREQEAYMQFNLDESKEDVVWDQMSQLLDEAMSRLRKKDREAVILRFFKEKNLGEVAAALNVTEAAAQSRVHRALEKLHRYFNQRGVSSTAAIIAGKLSANSVHAAPVTLAKSVTAVAIAKGATASGSTLTLIKGALKIMAWTKVKIAVVVCAALLLAVGSTTMVITKMESSSLDAYLQDPELDDISNAPPMVVIQPTHFPDIGKAPGAILGRTDGTREIGRNIDLSTAILKAYGFPSLRRMICPEEVNRIRVDYLVTMPDRPYKKFQAEIKRKFGYIAHVETREMNVFLLKVKRPNASGLTPADNSTDMEWSANHPYLRPGLHYHNITVSNFVEDIEPLVPKPVVDQTGLTGNYDFITGSFGPGTINQVFLDQLGLEFVPGREPIEMLVVEKAP
jgi:uncharacterized protein (TIGR03435 family)